MEQQRLRWKSEIVSSNSMLNTVGRASGLARDRSHGPAPHHRMLFLVLLGVESCGRVPGEGIKLHAGQIARIDQKVSTGGLAVGVLFRVTHVVALPQADARRLGVPVLRRATDRPTDRRCARLAYFWEMAWWSFRVCSSARFLSVLSMCTVFELAATSLGIGCGIAAPWYHTFWARFGRRRAWYSPPCGQLVVAGVICREHAPLVLEVCGCRL